jgi:hypothetical protein
VVYHGPSGVRSVGSPPRRENPVLKKLLILLILIAIGIAVARKVREV